MGSAERLAAFSAPHGAVQADTTDDLSVGSGNHVVLMRPTPDGEWHSIPLEGPSLPDRYSFHLTEGKPSSDLSRKVEFAMCGLSKVVRADGNDQESEALLKDNFSKKDRSFVSIESADGLNGVKEVRLSFHNVEEVKENSDNVLYKAGKLENDSGPVLGCGDEGCLPIVHQVREFIKGAKLSCGTLLSGDTKTFFFEGWSSVLQRSFSFRSCETSSAEGESLCKKSDITPLSRTMSTPMPITSKISGSGAVETIRTGPLQARDPQSRAESLPLAHYRPTDGPTSRDGDLKAGQDALSPIKSPGHTNCKKPPKPPRHPGRSSSLDSAALVAQRAARKSRERASAKRKSRTASAAASTGITPLVALVLTIGFGVLMVFQGVFVQTNVSYGRDIDRTFDDVTANLRSSLAARTAVPYRHRLEMDAQLLASYNAGGSSSEAVLEAFHKSMKELPWSRSSLSSQIQGS